MPPLSRSERDEFLQQPGILCRVATIQPGGAPHVTPIWFICENGAIYITPRAESAWLGHLRADPRVALTIDDQLAPYRKVTIEGTAELLHDLGDDDTWRDLYRRIARRYVAPEGAEHYVQETIDQPRALLRIPLAGSKVRTWRMPVAGEPYTGIWHRRYYLPGSNMAAKADGA
ncbi:MAG: PPOX class F420-dependent oxidoreductase [Dehalococcoidia bacterium]